ncbi:MAG: SoxR reducing system RseC family protein [Desulfobacteraceae bacterium]|nr:SoxR reducing system RseC family protein [Desulfobacteraceae bacterium]
MVTEKGIVTKADSTTAWIKTTKTAACESCSARDGCHTLGGGKEMEVEVENTAGAKEGDHVVIGFESGPLFKLSFLIYIFPIFSMILGAAIGQKIAPDYNFNPSTLSVIIAFLFFFLAFLGIKLTGKRLADKKEYQPRIVRISTS